MTERIDGILNIDKPSGITSMEVVRRIKRASGQKRVGHGGTLDPFASGVVPICIGRATRMMEYLVDGTKEYHATVRLGVETDTYDVDGEVVEERDVSGIDIEAIERALKPFVGMIEQVPPMFSALKKDGKRLYDIARAGGEVEREPRSVHVMGIKVEDWSATGPDHRGYVREGVLHALARPRSRRGPRLRRTPARAYENEEQRVSYRRGTVARRGRDLLRPKARGKMCFTPRTSPSGRCPQSSSTRVWQSASAMDGRCPARSEFRSTSPVRSAAYTAVTVSSSR